MALAERLMGIEEPKISVHQFYSAAAEYARGNMTGGQVTAAFSLSGPEQTQALALVNKVLSQDLSAQEVHDVLLLAEARIAPYTTAASVLTRFGF